MKPEYLKYYGILCDRCSAPVPFAIGGNWLCGFCMWWADMVTVFKARARR